MPKEESNEPKVPQLKETLDEAEWSWIKPHSLRDGVIVVSSGMNIMEAAEAIAADHSERVSDWIKKGLLKKPSLDQIEAWDRAPATRFLSIVVQPYVLIQEMIYH